MSISRMNTKVFLFAGIFLASSFAQDSVFSRYLTKDGKQLHIDGPRRLSDRIAIVGAGASGIHMATMLKERGFSNIVIYEQSGRIGGKSKTTRDPQNTIQELGSCCIGPGYENNIMKIIEKYAPGQLVPRKFGAVWLDAFENPISYNEYVVMASKKYFKTSNVTEAIEKLIGQIYRYISIHKSLFQTYEFELMPRPEPNILDKLRCSYLEFLRKYKVDALVPLLTLSHTFQGYGYLDEIGAFYGLLWNTPHVMGTFAQIILGDKTPRTFLLKIGFQHLWEIVADENKLNVRLEREIKKVERDTDGVTVCVEKSCEKYDFLIWSPELKKSLQLFQPSFAEEEALFSAMFADYMISSLVQLDGGKQAPTPTSYWFDNVINKRDESIWAARNTLEAIEAGGTFPYQQSTNNSGYDTTSTRFEIAYQYSRNRPCKPKRKAYTHFYETGAQSVNIKNQFIWRYFPHFSIDKTANGILWDILEMQGKHDTWYIGSSVSFESLKSVVEYNKLLISLMKPLEG